MGGVGAGWLIFIWSRSHQKAIETKNIFAFLCNGFVGVNDLIFFIKIINLQHARMWWQTLFNYKQNVIMMAGGKTVSALYNCPTSAVIIIIISRIEDFCLHYTRAVDKNITQISKSFENN